MYSIIKTKELEKLSSKLLSQEEKLELLEEKLENLEYNLCFQGERVDTQRDVIMALAGKMQPESTGDTPTLYIVYFGDNNIIYITADYFIKGRIYDDLGCQFFLGGEMIAEFSQVKGIVVKEVEE